MLSDGEGMREEGVKDGCKNIKTWNHDKKNKKRGKLGIFYDVQISWILEKDTSCTRSELSIKFAYRWKGCKLIVVHMHMDYLFPIGNYNVFSSQHCYFLNFKFSFIMAKIVPFYMIM